MSKSSGLAIGVWTRSARCVSDSHCVEVADLGETMGLRDSKRPEVSLTFSKPSWQTLVDAIKNGEFDLSSD